MELIVWFDTIKLNNKPFYNRYKNQFFLSWDIDNAYCVCLSYIAAYFSVTKKYLKTGFDYFPFDTSLRDWNSATAG
jgi:hypothetical protein